MLFVDYVQRRDAPASRASSTRWRWPTRVLTRHKTGQGLWPWPAAISVELPGIEPAPGNALNAVNAWSDDAKVRQTTRQHLREPGSC